MRVCGDVVGWRGDKPSLVYILNNPALSRGQEWKLEIATRFQDDEGGRLVPEFKNERQLTLSWY